MKGLIGIFAVVVTLSESLGCRSGWLNHGTSCYHLSHDQEAWINAEALCERFGGYLAEINDVIEDKFLQGWVNNINKQYWIGGTDLENEGEWLWVHSRTMLSSSYTNWLTGEPNSSGGSDENCIDMRPHMAGWNDEKCWITLNYIC
ncbi:perlucin-like [Dreissena polymorpha]|uniref:C-type lectin domain-containing protein n=1 Tax=Dreissena polymorpha TaxID=45954 RepID=A0A9D4KSM9_DREPO|nr:perlucin-like [Dreissena polymorpha]KAH3844849.1 hypothetical protein DPMN_087115 [Dreissena polymorpha]